VLFLRCSLCWRSNSLSSPFYSTGKAFLNDQQNNGKGRFVHSACFGGRVSRTGSQETHYRGVALEQDNGNDGWIFSVGSFSAQ
jgi:hypothetical protein